MLRNTQFGMSGPTSQAGNSGADFEIVTTAPKVAMAVTPHPDDCEGGCGGALSKWVRELGTEAVVVMCTNGNKGSSERDMTPEKLAATREAEQRAASNIVGAKDVVFLRYPDGGLEDTMLFRSQVVRAIRQYKPDLIMCIDPYRSTSHTHRDHRMSGRVALDAAFTYAWSYQHFPGADHRGGAGTAHGGAGLYVGQRVAGRFCRDRRLSGSQDSVAGGPTPARCRQPPPRNGCLV